MHPTCTVTVHILVRTVAAQELSEKGHLLGKQTSDEKKALERVDQDGECILRGLFPAIVARGVNSCWAQRAPGRLGTHRYRLRRSRESNRGS